MKFVFPFIGVLLTYFTVRWLTLANQVFTILRERHYDVWISIGAPRLRIGTDNGVESPHVQYIVQRRYLALDDPALHAVGDKACTSFRWALGLFLSVIFYGLAVEILKHW